MKQVLLMHYQKLSMYYKKKLIYSDILFPAWRRPDLDLLGEVIILIEKSLPRPSKQAIVNLKKLYNDFLKHRDYMKYPDGEYQK